jgi:hypothetical protein
VDKSCFVRHSATLAALGVNCKDACSMWYSVADLRIILDSCKDLKSLAVSFPMLGEGRRTFLQEVGLYLPRASVTLVPTEFEAFLVRQPFASVLRSRKKTSEDVGLGQV